MVAVSKHRRTEWLLYLVAAALGGLLVASLLGLRGPEPLEQPVTITACAPEVYDEGCPPGSSVDPDTLVLSEDLAISVTGDVCITETAAYDVEVAWVAVESEARFLVLDAPVTWKEGCVQYPTQDWVPPAQLLALAEDLEPGADLGRWKVIGTAEPVRADKYSLYQWDSVSAFRLEVG